MHWSIFLGASHIDERCAVGACSSCAACGIDWRGRGWFNGRLQPLADTHTHTCVYISLACMWSWIHTQSASPPGLALPLVAHTHWDICTYTTSHPRLLHMAKMLTLVIKHRTCPGWFSPNEPERAARWGRENDVSRGHMASSMCCIIRKSQRVYVCMCVCVERRRWWWWWSHWSHAGEWWLIFISQMFASPDRSTTPPHPAIHTTQAWPVCRFVVCYGHIMAAKDQTHKQTTLCWATQLHSSSGFFRLPSTHFAPHHPTLLPSPAHPAASSAQQCSQKGHFICAP